ncbi:hypothetical protein [Allomesorhizobium alhagi]|uniref:Transmembrane protein n=1 Tax=Mesorhizobium alhagi CCNWXJ12-2 TaxID=1107882 RepID=H0I122_9HYPH|nr:hypothetical protein [Mesorhizobium alhagi]EHK53315.1 hypothetical protein MAXJ12_30797 [Mesorhizobium alhagi CCNWXJ12-2]
MIEFESAILGNFAWFNFVLGLVNVIVCGRLAIRLKRSLAISLMGFVLAMLISILTAIVAVIAVAAWYSSRFFTAAAENTPGFLAWSLETGIEFGLPGIVAGLVAYVIVRLR